MKRTPVEDVRAGLIWVRQIIGEQDLGRGPWAIAEIQGTFPFLYGTVYLQKPEFRPDRHVIENPNEWEFGPRIDPPNEEVDEQ